MGDDPGHFRLQKVGGGAAPQFVWVLTTSLGQTMAISEHFPDRVTAENAIAWVKANVNNCPTLDPPSRGPTIA
jgi:uncharacterized protein YegP (UPF0339 family)